MNKTARQPTIASRSKQEEGKEAHQVVGSPPQDRRAEEAAHRLPMEAEPHRSRLPRGGELLRAPAPIFSICESVKRS